MDQARTYRPDIDGLRCVAILTVVLAHAGMPGLAGGYVGVDVFFVISGFLITRILWDELPGYPATLAGFYERRARRILPALMAAMAATLAAGFVALGPRAFAELARSAIATTLFVSNVLFWNTSSDYFGADVRLAPLLHTWSLAVEEQFYILFPLILALIARGGRRRALLAIAGICLVSFALSEHALLTGRQQAAFYLLHSRAWELGLGAALALGALPVLRGRLAAEAIALLAAAAILVPVLAYGSATRFPGLAALPPCLGTAALIWLHGSRGTAVRTALAWRPVVFVGLISYSVYVWHWPIIVFDRILHGEPTPLRSLACIALSLAVGAASWAWIERPFRRPWGPLHTRRAVFAASAAAMAAMTVTGAVISLSNGLPGRLPPVAARAFAAADDTSPLGDHCRGIARIGDTACRFGAQPAGEAADFLLWGDSHAGAVLPGVEAAAVRAGRNGFVVGQTACAPLLGVDRIDLGTDSRCSDFAAAVLKFLQGRDDMPVVILAGRWALAAEGSRSDEPERNALLAPRAGSLPSGTVADNLAVFRAGLADTVAAIRATGRRVVILGGVPEIGWSVPDVLGAHLMHGTPLPPAPTAGEVASRNARVDAVLAELAREPGVAVLPLAPIFCTPGCAVNDAEGRPLYVDDDHLSRTGAAEMLGGPIHDAVWGAGAMAVR
ncbi:MAG: acyltransferase family protein [Amaricoccus sp.]